MSIKAHVHCTMYLCRVYIYVNFALYTVYCTVYTVLCTIYTVQYTLYSVHSVYYAYYAPLVRSTVQCTVYTVHCTVQPTVYRIYLRFIIYLKKQCRKQCNHHRQNILVKVNVKLGFLNILILDIEHVNLMIQCFMNIVIYDILLIIS